jgi:hypothetical protein
MVGTLKKAAAIANHASTRTTQLYDLRHDELSLDEVERIFVCSPIALLWIRHMRPTMENFHPVAILPKTSVKKIGNSKSILTHNFAMWRIHPALIHAM